MTQLAPTLEAYFTLRLIGQRQASPHTVASYRDAFKLLLAFAAQQTGRPPSRLQLEDLDAKLIGAFLDHLETERANAVRTRNARLAALHSMFRFAALRHPEHAALIARVLAIPPKRTERAIVQFLTEDEIDALLASPDRSRWIGRRDHALLLVIETGLRVSELVGLRCQDVALGSGAHVRCFGKGRKERVTPLTAPTVAVLRAWLHERHGEPSQPLFPASRGGPLSRDAVERHPPGTARQPPRPARPSSARNLPRTSFATAAPSSCGGPGWTRPHSRYGSATRAFVRPTSTTMPTSPSRSRPWHAPSHEASPRDVTSRPTLCSPSSKACDYADSTGPPEPSWLASLHRVGIIARSA